MPAVAAVNAPVPFPFKIPVNDVAPVPPSATASVPVRLDAPRSTFIDWGESPWKTKPPLDSNLALTVEPLTVMPLPALTLEPPEDAIVIEPLPSVIVILLPAVSVESV